MNKKLRQWICIFVFLLVGLTIFYFLRKFTNFQEEIYIVTWDEINVVEENGEKSPAKLDEWGEPVSDDGKTYEKSVVIPQEVYEIKDAYLAFNATASEISIFLDDGLLWEGTIQQTDWYMAEEVSVNLPQDADAYVGKKLTMYYRYFGNEKYPMTPVMRILSASDMEAANYAYANYYSIQLGVISIIFLIVCGVFLFSLYLRRANWTILLPAAAMLLFVFSNIVQGLGYFFLPRELILAFNKYALIFIPPLLLIFYLIWNYKNGYLKYFAKTTAVAAGAAGIVLIAAFLKNNSLLPFTSVLEALRDGNYEAVLYWLTWYLIVVVVGIMVYEVIKLILSENAEKLTLHLKNQMMIKNYQIMEEKAKDIRSLQHEMRKHIQVLELLSQSKEWGKITEYIHSLNEEEAIQTQTQFTGHLLINLIMRNYATKAEKTGVSLEAVINVPSELGIEVNDLSSLLMNMLDNAFEACAKLEPSKRVICLHMEKKEKFLAILCENAFDGKIKEDKKGCILTGKEDKKLHGFGLRQMEKIAVKYGSLLEVSYTKGVAGFSFCQIWKSSGGQLYRGNLPAADGAEA